MFLKEFFEKVHFENVSRKLPSLQRVKMLGFEAENPGESLWVQKIRISWRIIYDWVSRFHDPPPPPPPEKSQKYRVSLQYWSVSLENHKATKPAFNVEPSSAHQRNTILMEFRWRANDDPLIVVFGSSLSSSTKKTTYKKCQSWTPSDKTFWIRAWILVAIT